MREQQRNILCDLFGDEPLDGAAQEAASATLGIDDSAAFETAVLTWVRTITGNGPDPELVTRIHATSITLRTGPDFAYSAGVLIRVAAENSAPQRPSNAQENSCAR